jgi:molybdate transport system substrate-binding protein
MMITKFRRLVTRSAALCTTIFALATGVVAGEAKVAVAANFAEPARELSAAFEAATGHTLKLSFGATGQFFAQITQGAPFDVFLAADTATPAKAAMEGHAVSGSAFTYAMGRLALMSRSLDVSDGPAVLKAGAFAKLAIANPATAPYGTAAMETLVALGLTAALTPKIVQGTNIAQTLQFVETGNAEVGFVALSQVARTSAAFRWIVPAALHKPIAQGAVLLKSGAANPAATAFLDYLKSPAARATIEKFGYSVPDR